MKSCSHPNLHASFPGDAEPSFSCEVCAASFTASEYYELTCTPHELALWNKIKSATAIAVELCNEAIEMREVNDPNADWAFDFGKRMLKALGSDHA